MVQSNERSTLAEKYSFQSVSLSIESRRYNVVSSIRVGVLSSAVKNKNKPKNILKTHISWSIKFENNSFAESKTVTSAIQKRLRGNFILFPEVKKQLKGTQFERAEKLVDHSQGMLKHPNQPCWRMEHVVLPHTDTASIVHSCWRKLLWKNTSFSFLLLVSPIPNILRSICKLLEHP